MKADKSTSGLIAAVVASILAISVSQVAHAEHETPGYETPTELNRHDYEKKHAGAKREDKEEHFKHLRKFFHIGDHRESGKVRDGSQFSGDQFPHPNAAYAEPSDLPPEGAPQGPAPRVAPGSVMPSSVTGERYQSVQMPPKFVAAPRRAQATIPVAAPAPALADDGITDTIAPPAKFSSAPRQPVPVPAKFSAAAKRQLAQPEPDDIQPPAKFSSAPRAPAPVQSNDPIQAPAKLQAAVKQQTVAAPVEEQPAPVQPPAKFQAATKQVVNDIPAPTKMGSAPKTQPADPDNDLIDPSAVPPKMRAAAKSAAVPAPAAAPQAPGDQMPDILQPVAPSAAQAQVTAPVKGCTPGVAPQSGITQVAALGKTLNESLGDNQPGEVKIEELLPEPDAKKWDDKDYKDSKALVQAGDGQRINRNKAKTTEKDLTPFLKKLHKYSMMEVNRNERSPGAGRPMRRRSRPNQSLLLCLQGVRMAFQEAAGQKTAGWGGTGNAKDAGKYLPQYGYKKSPVGKYNEYNAPAGSVLVYDSPGRPNHPGHIEIHWPEGNYSDFFEKDPITKKLHGQRRLVQIWVPGGSDTASN